MDRRFPFAALCLCQSLAGGVAAAPVVSGITASQRGGTKQVDLIYDLEGNGFGSATVTLEVSSDGGASFSVPVDSAAGDIGEGVLPGRGKQIVWDAGNDWGGNRSERMRFRLTAKSGFAEIPGGPSVIGRTGEDPDGDAPQTIVTLGTFHLQETETTKSQWDRVRLWALANGYPDLAPGSGKGPDHPVQSVTWFDVVKWLNARSEREGLTPVYRVGGAVYRSGTAVPEVDWSAGGYRLPTEAEWEKAARGGTEGKRFPWATDRISHERANFQNSGGEDYQDGTTGFHPLFAGTPLPHTSPAGSFPGNGFGLRDLSGNVSEWCWDWYAPDAYADSANPRGPDTGTNRVARGGSWEGQARAARAAHRDQFHPSTADDGLGFRPARGRLFDGQATIPGGTFPMGRTSGDNDADAPSVAVTVSAFLLRETEVTGSEWEETRTWALANGYTGLAPGSAKAPDHPVQSVSWYDAVKWCNARSEREGLTPCYRLGGEVMRIGTALPEADWEADGYRLPTEAEWERAARSGKSGVRFPWGTDAITHPDANYYSSAIFYSYDTSATRDFHPGFSGGAAPFTSPSGYFASNGFGLSEMAGNVAEWCWDWYDSSYYLSSQGTTDPRGASPSGYRVVRGGAWSSLANRCRSSDRSSALPSDTSSSIGFRTGRSLPESAGPALSDEIGVDTRASAILTINGLARTYDGSPQAVSATTDPPGLPVAFTYDGLPDPPAGAGTYEVNATITDANFQGSASGTLVVARAGQTISFPHLSDALATGTVPLEATGGGSGNAVTFSVDDGPARIEGDPPALVFTGAGTVRVTASQAGNANHEAATPVTREFRVSKAQATVTLSSLSQVWDGEPKSPLAQTDPPGLPVSFTYDDSDEAPAGIGNYAVVASIDSPLHEGRSSRVLVIVPAPQTIAFAPPGDRFVREIVNLSATGGASGEPVTFRVVSGPARIERGGRLVFTGAGRVVVAADQAAGGPYAEATRVTHSFNVLAPRPDVSVGAARGKLHGTGVYLAPARQQVSLTSVSARTIVARATVSNRTLLPERRAAERLAVRGTRGTPLFRIAYFGRSGNLSASVIAGTHQTPWIDGRDAPVSYRIVVSPDRKKLVKTTGSLTAVQRKTQFFLIRAQSTSMPASDAGLLRVLTR